MDFAKMAGSLYQVRRVLVRWGYKRSRGTRQLKLVGGRGVGGGEMKGGRNSTVFSRGQAGVSACKGSRGLSPVG